MAQEHTPAPAVQKQRQPEHRQGKTTWFAAKPQERPGCPATQIRRDTAPHCYHPPAGTEPTAGCCTQPTPAGDVWPRGESPCGCPCPAAAWTGRIHPSTSDTASAGTTRTRVPRSVPRKPAVRQCCPSTGRAGAARERAGTPRPSSDRPGPKPAHRDQQQDQPDRDWCPVLGSASEGPPPRPPLTGGGSNPESGLAARSASGSGTMCPGGPAR